MMLITKRAWGRWLAMLLSVAMLLTMLPATVLAAGFDSTERQITVQEIQALIDALPDADTITAENRVDVEAQLSAIDEARLGLGDEEVDSLDITRYLAAVEAIQALDDMAGADEPMTVATGVPYIGTNGTEEMCPSATEVVSSATEWNESWYVVNSAVAISERITVTGAVNLILADGFSLTASAGITVSDGNSLTIWGQSDGTGTLTATGNDIWLAGIGSNGQNDKCGAIVINGGTVEATGGNWTAGIGGEGGTITINGGNVKAVGGNNGAGIGGVSGGSIPGTITITGGTVDAHGGGNGSGIGAGASDTMGTVTISGGFVSAVCAPNYQAISGDFSTGPDGEAVIVCDSIYDSTPGDEWSGIFCSGSGPEMNVYGEQTLTPEVSKKLPSVELNIHEGASLTVESGAGLTLTGESKIAENGTLINNGNITNNSNLTNLGKLENVGSITNNGQITNNGTITGEERITGNLLSKACNLTVSRVDFGVVARDYTTSELSISLHNDGPEDATIVDMKLDVDAHPFYSESVSTAFQITEGNKTIGAGQTDTSWKIKTMPGLPAGLYHASITFRYNGMEYTEITVPVEFKVFLEGEGTSSSPALISDLTELEMFRDVANAGVLVDCYSMYSVYFKLTDDIDLSSKYGPDIGGKEVSWEPIGYIVGFRGTFDGGGHTISGLYINNPNENRYVGLFSMVDRNSTVKNLTVDGTVTSSSFGAGIVGRNWGTVENCHNSCKLIVRNSSGGVVGNNEGGIVTNCYNTGDISGSNNIGGVVGCNGYGGTVTNCYNTGDISGSNNIGGVVGRNNDGSTVDSCYNTGNISGSGAIGSIVGRNRESNVTNSYYLSDTAASGIGDDDDAGYCDVTAR